MMEECSVDELYRRVDECYKMAGLAAQDGDGADCARQTALAKQIEAEIRRRLS